MAEGERVPAEGERPAVEFGKDYRLEFFAWGGVKVIHLPAGQARREFFLGDDVVGKIARRWLGTHRSAPAAGPLQLLFDRGERGASATREDPGEPAVPPTLFFTFEADGVVHEATIGYLEDATYPVEPRDEMDDGVRTHAHAAEVGPYLVAAYNFCRSLGLSAEGMEAYVAAVKADRVPLSESLPRGVVAALVALSGGPRG